MSQAKVTLLESEGLKVHHFHPVTGKQLTDETNQEIIKNSLAEYFSKAYEKDIQFTIGEIEEGITKAQDLEKHKDKSPQFSSGTRVFFTNKEELREKIFPNPSDGAAYGSNVFTGCNRFHEIENAKILILDDETGENPIGLEPETAKRLVGDCYGRIDNSLHEKMGNQPNTPFQFRFGTNPQQNDPYHRLGKGTLAPRQIKANLAKVSGRDESEFEDYDFILPTSAFKGRKEESKLKPGVYNWNCGLGNKTDAYESKQSVGAQVLGFYPEGVRKDVLPRVEKKLKKIEEIRNDPRKLALAYVDSEKKRKQFQAENEDNPQNEENLNNEEETELSNIAAILETDANNYSQLLEHNKLVQLLNNYTQKQYKEAAMGRAFEFEGALLQPHPNLKEGEICCPHIKNNEKLIALRSPVVNSNGVITLKNTHLDDAEAMADQGVIFMNPKDAAHHIQGDFDGDRIAFDYAKKYPTLTREIEEAHQPENRFPDVKKQDKVPYTGTFAEIAIACSSDQIGLIANQVMKAQALKVECQNCPSYQKRDFLEEQQKAFRTLLSCHDDPEDNYTIPINEDPELMEAIVKGMREATKAGKAQEISETKVDETLNGIANNIYKTQIGLLGNQLQIAVDGPKSASRPQEEIVNFSKSLIGKLEVSWLPERKDAEAYKNREMFSNRNGPIDDLIKISNKYYNDSQLEVRPSQQFQKLFNKVKVEERHYEQANTILKEFNERNQAAHRAQNQLRNGEGIRVGLTSPRGNKLYAYKIGRSNYGFDNLQAAAASQTSLDIMLFPPEQEKGKTEWSVVAKQSGVEGEKYKKLGVLTPDSEGEHEQFLWKNSNHHQRSIPLKQMTPTIEENFTEKQVKRRFEMLRNWSEQVREEIPIEDRRSVAAAVWEELNKAQGTSEEQAQYNFNVASAAFRIFAPEIREQLEEQQFTKFTLVHPSDKTLELAQSGDEIEFQVGREKNEKGEWQRTIEINGETAGKFPLVGNQLGAQLPIKTRGTGVIKPIRSATAYAETESGLKFKMGRIQQGPKAQTTWNGETETVVLGIHETPTRYGNLKKMMGVYQPINESGQEYHLNRKGELYRDQDNTKMGVLAPDSFERYQSVLTQLQDEQTIQFPGTIRGSNKKDSETGRPLLMVKSDRATAEIKVLSTPIGTLEVNNQKDNPNKESLEELRKEGSLTGKEISFKLNSKITTFEVELTDEIELPEMWEQTEPREEQTSPTDEIYSDGACSGNPGPGGWGIAVTGDSGQTFTHEEGGSASHTTNNRMEIKGAIAAIHKANALNRSAIIKTDSNLVNQAINGKDGGTPWLEKWEGNGFKTAKKKPVENQDLWKELSQSLKESKVSITVEKVAGHSNIPGNERADAIAVKYRDLAKSNSATQTDKTEKPLNQPESNSTPNTNQATTGITLNCEHSCNNAGIGNWKVTAEGNSPPQVKTGSQKQTTSQQMALQATIQGIKFAQTFKQPVILNPGSAYVQDGINNNLEKWKANRWRTSGNKAVKNQTLWQKLDEILQNSTVDITIGDKQYKAASPQKEENNQSSEKVKVVNVKLEKADIFIGRGSPLGNPFDITPNQGRNEVVEGNCKYLGKIMKGESPQEAIQQVTKEKGLTIKQGWKAPSREEVFDQLIKIEKYAQDHGSCKVGCYCKQKEKEVACHGDNIKELLSHSLWEQSKKEYLSQAVQSSEKKAQTIKAPTPVQTIISGGQSGADRAGLEVGKKLGIQTGGIAPRNFEAFPSDGSKGKAQPELSLIQLGLTTFPKPLAKIAPGINIASHEKGLGGALTNPTEISKRKGNIKKDYPIEYQGQTYLSAENAYQKLKNTIPDEQKQTLMTNLIQHKLEQHPALTDAITQCGGTKWLEKCSHHVPSAKSKAWEGEGRNSTFIQVLIGAYELTMEKQNGHGLSLNERMIANLKQADGTVLFAKTDEKGKPISRESQLTLDQANKLGKPILVINDDQMQQNPELASRKINQWLKQKEIKTLNVAGNREQKTPGINQRVQNVLTEALRKEDNQTLSPNQLNPEKRLTYTSSASRNTLDIIPAKGKEGYQTQEGTWGIDQSGKIVNSQKDEVIGVLTPKSFEKVRELIQQKGRNIYVSGTMTPQQQAQGNTPEKKDEAQSKKETKKKEPQLQC
ncbi:MAG: DUF4326 domain-containing protein [Cyanobacteria bacterium]|jgi:ribonuclease HI|nr:DUF4326 domain-containing protein [Cyanobacteria bacterium GSL.Bin21]